LKIKQQQVQELQTQQTGLLKDLDPEKEDEMLRKKARVEERYEPIINK